MVNQSNKDWKQPQMECPKCGKVEDDFDGMGFAFCDECGYCDHRTQDLIDGRWICGGCGESV